MLLLLAVAVAVVVAVVVVLLHAQHLGYMHNTWNACTALGMHAQHLGCMHSTWDACTTLGMHARHLLCHDRIHIHAILNFRRICLSVKGNELATNFGQIFSKRVF
jgi:hypothetical protein